MTLRGHLESIYAAERALRAAESKLLAGPPDEVAAVLIEATREALAMDDKAESFLRSRLLPDLLAQVPRASTVDALLSILDSDDPTVRVEAGEALLDVAYERFKDVAQSIERLLAKKHAGVAMQELPFILIEVHDPDPLPLIVRFLSHPEAEVAGAAIEALAERGDPAAIEHIAKLEKDEREVTLDEVDEGPTTLGDLAAAAIEELGGDDR